MKKLIPLVLIIIAILLTACGFDLQSTIYVQDIIDLPTIGAPIYSGALINAGYMEQEDLQGFEDLVTQHLKDVENVRIEEVDYTDSALAEFSIPMIYGESFPGSQEIYSVYVEHQGEIAYIYFVINTEKYNALNQGVAEQNGMELDLAESSIQLVIVNDARQDIHFYTYGVFVNGSPTPYDTQFTIEHRDSIQIDLGDVLMQSFTVPMNTDPKGYTIRLIARMDLP